jgi:UDP-N-acetylglucosamine acyltransferase
LIHPTALVDPQACLDADVEIGPYSIIGPGVELGRGVRIGPHAVVRGPSRIGAGTRIFQFASVGEEPQDKKYGGEETRLDLGERNVVREYVTLHRGTVQDAGVTRIGDDNLFMAYVHVAHDCRIGNNVILANAASLAGHVHVDDWAILGGFSLVHQFCRIGANSFSAMGSVIAKDVPPFVLTGGHPAEPRGVNAEGLRRRGYDAERVQRIKNAYRLLYLSGRKLDEALAEMRKLGSPDTDAMADFVTASTRSIVR